MKLFKYYIRINFQTRFQPHCAPNLNQKWKSFASEAQPRTWTFITDQQKDATVPKIKENGTSSCLDQLSVDQFSNIN